MTSRKGIQRESNAGEITIFTTKWCGACRKRVPQIIRKVQTAGLEVRLIDWDELSAKEQEKLGRVQFVPHIDYQGREIDEEELNRLCINHGEE